MALMLMRPNNFCIDGHVVGNYGTSTNSLVPTEILGGISGVEGVDLGLEALAIAAGMQLITDVEELEGWQRSRGVADGVIGGMYGFGP